MFLPFQKVVFNYPLLYIFKNKYYSYYNTYIYVSIDDVVI